MSAIFGFCYLDGRPAEQPDLERMMERLAHRGADGSGIWQDGSVGLGHRMTWTTPESLSERLPLVGRAGELAITADARLDNREELISLLGLTSRPAGDLADSEVILAAYERWGEACPERLLGDFAFAIWDARRRMVFCARDPMGVKPLYYHHSNRLFVFASEIKALHCLPEVPRKIDEVRIAYHLARLYDEPSMTFYEDVFRLPAAHCLSVSPAGVRTRRYWAPDLSKQIRFRSDQEYAEALRDVFAKAVRCRMRSAFPVGSMLSGGLDSSSIACMARNVLRESGGQLLHTFSAIFPNVAALDPKIDERRYMNAVLATGGFEPHWFTADEHCPVTDFHWQGDEPIPHPNLYMDRGMFEAAHAHGVRTVLSGHDGDSTISYGYEYLYELLLSGRWLTLNRESDAVARRLRRGGRRRIVWRFGVQPLLPNLRVFGRNEPLWGPNTGISDDFARRVRLAERAKAMDGGLSWNSRRNHWRSLGSGLNVYVMELFDTVAAPLDLEVRYPFSDRRMVELCLALPASQKLQRGVSRSVMRRAMAGILPTEVQTRLDKAVLSSNLRTKLFGAQRELIERVIRGAADLEQYVDRPALLAAFQRCAARPEDRAVDDDAFSIFVATVLGLWLDRANGGCSEYFEEEEDHVGHRTRTEARVS